MEARRETATSCTLPQLLVEYVPRKRWLFLQFENETGMPNHTDFWHPESPSQTDIHQCRPFVVPRAGLKIWRKSHAKPKQEQAIILKIECDIQQKGGSHWGFLQGESHFPIEWKHRKKPNQRKAKLRKHQSQQKVPESRSAIISALAHQREKMLWGKLCPCQWQPRQRVSSVSRSAFSRAA